MWTHLQPFLNDDFTAQSIARHARVGLWYALTHGRLICFTGSGISRAYGMPSWTGTAALFLQETRKSLDDAYPHNRQRSYDCKALILQINRLSQIDEEKKDDRHVLHLAPVSANYNDSALTLLDLCEELLRKLPEREAGGSHLDRAREGFAQNFRNGIEENTGARLLDIIDPNEWPLPSSQKPVCGGDPFLDALKNIANEARDLSKIPETLLKDIAAVYMQSPDQRCETRIDAARDPIDTIFNQLGVSRVLTLNYDLELERWINANRPVPSTGNARGFFDLCTGRNGEGNVERLPPKSRIEVVNGASRIALSVSLNRANVGDLINFGSYAHAYEQQVFHLHGRADLPQDIVVSLADYNGVYVRDELSQQAFEAAQEIVFAGNDVLFLGVGMDEDDVLRPFRRFVSREGRSGQSPRRTFALMPSSVDEDWREKNDLRAVQNAIRYDVYTLFYGGPDYRSLRRFLHAITGLKEKLTAFDAATIKRCKKALTDLSNSSANQNEQCGLTPEEKSLVKACSNLLESLEQAPKRVSLGHIRLLKLAAGELESRVTSRALVAELKELDLGAQTWGRAWRDAPHERKARFHMVVQDDPTRPDGQQRFWTRHRNDLNLARIDQDILNAGVLNELVTAARAEATYYLQERQRRRTKRPSGKKIGERHAKRFHYLTNIGVFKRRRIMRLTAERGGGKGTIVGLLHNPTLRRAIFSGERFCSDGTECINEPSHAGSFLAHLSFSIEFNSVVKSLCRFLARQIAEIYQQENGKVYERAVKAVEDELRQAPIDGYDRLRRLRELARLQEAMPAKKAQIRRMRNCAVSNQVVPDKPKKGEPWVSANDMKKLAEQVFVLRCEDEPELLKTLSDLQHLEDWIADEPAAGRWSKRKLGKETPREHRLDQLSTMLRLLEEKASGKHRYFVCLSGLDKLSDDDGDAFNPAHRAFFRLITGREERSDGAPANPPIDYVFIAGRSDAPICYLSEDLGVVALDTGTTTKLKIGDLSRYADRSKTRRLIRKWHRLGHLSWEIRRHALEVALNDPSINTDLEEITKELIDVDSSTLSRRVDRDSGLERLHRILWHNLALSNWVMSLWGLSKGVPGVPELANLDTFLGAFEGAAARSGNSGILKLILDLYERVDQTQGTKMSGYDDVIRQILQHLTLFALPVEPWVLMGCPLIYDRLKKHYLAAYGSEPRPQNPASRAWSDWFERAWMLNMLKDVMDELSRRGLVMKIEAPEDVASSSSNVETDGFLHRRFALHGLMREHLAGRMQLAVIDGADLNYHRMSIYCDQPRDLPTPSVDHFRMIESVLSEMIRRSRETLWMLAKIGPVSAVHPNLPWDPEEGPESTSLVTSAAKAAARRFFAPDVAAGRPKLDGEERAEVDGLITEFNRVFPGETWHKPDGLAGGLGRLHAVPQRLRASLSLLQGTFSIGALSRLDSGEFTFGKETPYDAYRNWLRSLTNAGASLGQSRHAVNNLFEDLSFLDTPCPSEFGRQTEIVEGKPELFANREECVFENAENLGFKDRQKTSLQRLRHPFYRDEIAWLYNEHGLVCLAQGKVLDALPLFDQASFIMSHRRTPNEDKNAYHAAERSIRLNYGIAQIERGELIAARDTFRDLESTSAHVSGSTPSRTRALARLYSALCDHMTGGQQAARIGYENAIQEFVATREHRPAAIANRHLADLLSAQGSHDKAIKQVEIAIASASHAQQRDIFYLSTISKARILIRAKEREDEVLPLIQQAIEYAMAMGQDGLLVDAKLALTHLQMARGEYSRAGQIAAEAVAKAVRNGLQLRQVAGLVVLAEAKFKQNDFELARSILIEAKSLADELSYLTQAARATRALSKLDATASSSRQLNRHAD